MRKKKIALPSMCAVACLVATWMTAAPARADFDLSLAIGYSHLSLDGAERFEDRDGLRLEPRISFGPSKEHPELRLGFGLGISGYAHELDQDTIITIDDGDEVHVIEADQWENVSLLVPEFQISWRATLAGHDVWFIEPGVGIGPVFANYYVADEFWWSDDDESEWDTTFGVRPFVRAGFQNDRWMLGLEASYLFGGNIELTDQVKGDLQEFYAGGFFGWRW